MALVADNLRSVDTFELLLGLAAGTIEGYNESKEKSLYLDDTPFEAYEDLEATLYEGTAMGTTVPLTLGGQASNNRVGVQLETGTPVVRRGTSLSADRVRRLEVRLLFSALYNQDEKKGLREGKCRVKLEYKAASAAAWTEVNVYEIDGKTTSNYVKEYIFQVPASTEHYDVRVTKESPAEDDAKNIAHIFWESFQEVIPENPTYSNLAMLHIRGRGSNQLQGVPNVWGDYQLKKVKIPTGYDPVAKTYAAGIWDGTFQSDLFITSNPIWCLYDLATDAVNGVASYYNVNLDKFSAYQAARWCDELVPDGKGGMQPRFTMNMLITDPVGAKELLRYVAGLCACVYFDDGNGNAFIRADINTDPVALFTPENVIEGEFNYSYTDINTRHNDLTVEFVNPDLGWQPDRRRVFDQTSINEIGRIPFDFVAVGCTNEAEALRRARHHVVSSKNEKQFVTFKANRLALALSPYDVFLVADPKVGYAMTGRITGQNGAVVTIRDPVTMEAGHTYVAKFSVPNPDYPDTEQNPFNIIERDVTVVSPGLPVTELELSAALPPEVDEFATFSIESSHIFGTPKRFRLIGVKETEGTPDIVDVMGLEVYQNKWAEILGETFTPIQYSVADPFGAPPSPTGLGLSIEFRDQGAFSKPFLTGTIFGSNLPTSVFQVAYRRDGGARTILNTDEPSFEIEDIPAGIYSFSVQAVGKTGKLSGPFERTFVVEDNLVDPNAPTVVGLVNEKEMAGEFDLFPIITWTKAGQDTFVDQYRVTVRALDGTEINSYDVDADKTTFSYDAEKLASDNPGRSFQLCVSSIQGAQVSRETCITVTNPKPSVSGLAVNPKVVGSEISINPVTDRDYLRTVIWADTTPGFTPGVSNMVYSGAATTYHHVHTETLWFRVAVLDSYDPADYDVSIAMEGVPALIGGSTAGGLDTFASGIRPVVIVPTEAERDAFLNLPNPDDIPPFVYVTGLVPPTLFEYDPATNTYRAAIDVDLSNIDLTGLDLDFSGIPSNVMPNTGVDDGAMSDWIYFGTASRVAIMDGPARFGCLVIQTPGTGQESGCKSPFIPVIGGETYAAGAGIRV